MDVYDEETDLEATAEQLDLLRELGVTEPELQGMSVATANELIAELQAERNAGKF